MGVAAVPAFCTELTGITQDMVDSQPTWSSVLEMFVSWYEDNNLSPLNSTFVTCGLWDLKTMLPRQCHYSGLDIPHMLDVGASGHYVNIKYSFQQHTGKYAKVTFLLGVPKNGDLCVRLLGLKRLQRFCVG